MLSSKREISIGYLYIVLNRNKLSFQNIERLVSQKRTSVLTIFMMLLHITGTYFRAPTTNTWRTPSQRGVSDKLVQAVAVHIKQQRFTVWSAVLFCWGNAIDSDQIKLVSEHILGQGASVLIPQVSDDNQNLLLSDVTVCILTILSVLRKTPWSVDKVK